MHKCNEHPEQANTTLKTVLFRTNSEGGGGKGIGVKGKGKQSERGKNKQKWTKEEREVLWECYVRSGRRGCLGFIKRVMEMWEGRDIVG